MLIFSALLFCVLMFVVRFYLIAKRQILDIVSTQVKLITKYKHEVMFVDNARNGLDVCIKNAVHKLGINGGNIKLVIAYINSANKIEISYKELHCYMDDNTYLLLSSKLGIKYLVKQCFPGVKIISSKIWFDEASISSNRKVIG